MVALAEEPLTSSRQGFSYGLLDTLNKHFQITLGITRTRSSGLQAAYFGYVLFNTVPKCYPSDMIGKEKHLLTECN